MTRVGLDPGHGAEDRGCVYHGITEATYNMDLVYVVAEMLATLDWDFEPVVLRDRGEDPSLFERGDRAREEECDLVLSFHVNAAKRTDFHGALFFHMPGNKIARKVAGEMAHCWPKPLRKPSWGPIPATDEPQEDDDWLQRPRNVLLPHECPAVLLEIGYASNLYDAAALKTEAVKDAMLPAILAGLVAFRRAT